MSTIEYVPTVIVLTYKSSTREIVTQYPKAALPYLRDALSKTFETLTFDIAYVKHRPIPDDLVHDILESEEFTALRLMVFKQQELLYAMEDVSSSLELLKRVMQERDEKEERCRYLGHICEKETVDLYMDTMLSHGFECLNANMEIVNQSEVSLAKESYYVRLDQNTRAIPYAAFEAYAFRKGHYFNYHEGN